MHSGAMIYDVLCLSVSIFFLLQLHTDMDHGDNAVKYTLSGEGAGSIFIIDPVTGDIHALVGLDR